MDSGLRGDDLGRRILHEDNIPAFGLCLTIEILNQSCID